MLAATLILVLFMRTAYIWFASYVMHDIIDKVLWIWPSFLFTNALVSELYPFCFFCYILFRQILFLNRVHKRNNGLEIVHAASKEMCIDDEGAD